MDFSFDLSQWQFNLNSTIQMQEFLYEFLGLEPLKPANEKTGNISVDEATITHFAEQNGVKFCALLIAYRKLLKAKNTYLADILRNISDEDFYLHPEFWLNTAETYRSCIAKGTMIDVVRDVSKYPDGIPIEDVKVDDQVYCYDNNLKPAIKKVLWSGKTGHREVIRIHWKTQTGKTGYLDCTPEHKIKTINGNYIQAKDLLDNDLRSKEQSKYIPKASVLALGRSHDELYFTGITTKHNRGLKEYRFIYEQLIGPLKDNEIIHHKDNNHLNHLPSNLKKTTLSKHSKSHSDHLNEPISRLKNKIAVKRGWKEGKYKNAVKYGSDNGNSLNLTKKECIDELIRIKGLISKTQHDFNTFKKYLNIYDITKEDIKLIKQNTKPNNHFITKIEWINKIVDVYDLEIEDHHNFIANEICVHNSSTDPNFQNIPKHGQIVANLMWKIIRKMFTTIPHPDWLLAEVDYVGAETKVAGMLGNDPQMIQDLNEDLDMHSHWAIELFGLKGMSYKEVKEKYDDTYRFLAKNNFTFANFFGAGNTSIAEEMRKSEHYEQYVKNKWNMNLNKKGNWETYYIQFSEDHIAKCQQAFYSRYAVYKKWQDSLVTDYFKNGYVDNPFGFRRRYPLKRNEIINHPIQSTSFLLLLDSLIRIEEEMEKDNRWQSHLIGQIHDSAMANVLKWEAPDFIDMVDEKMCHKPHLPWTMKVKMNTDWSFGKNWLNMFKVNEYQYVN